MYGTDISDYKIVASTRRRSVARQPAQTLNGTSPRRHGIDRELLDDAIVGQVRRCNFVHCSALRSPSPAAPRSRLANTSSNSLTGDYIPPPLRWFSGDRRQRSSRLVGRALPRTSGSCYVDPAAVDYRFIQVTSIETRRRVPGMSGALLEDWFRRAQFVSVAAERWRCQLRRSALTVDNEAEFSQFIARCLLCRNFWLLHGGQVRRQRPAR